MRLLLVLGITGLAIIAAALMLGMRQEPPKKERDDLDSLVDVIELESMTANFEVRSQGTVRPLTETVLSAEISGTIKSISPKFVAVHAADRRFCARATVQGMVAEAFL